MTYEHPVKEDPSEIGKAEQDPELQPIVQRLEQLMGLLAQHDQDEAKSSLTTENVEAVKEEISSMLSMLAIEMARKKLVFDTAIATPTDKERHAPITLMQRWMHALATDRFCKDLGLIKKPLSYVITGLLLVSLIGWSAEPLANSLQLAVNNLRVNVFEQDATRALDAALSQALSPPREVPNPDARTPSAPMVQTVSRLLAHTVTRDMVRSGILDRLKRSERAALSEAEFVRASVIEQHIDLPEHADALATGRPRDNCCPRARRDIGRHRFPPF